MSSSEVKSARKSKSKPKRFQLDPLASPGISAVDNIAIDLPRFELEELPEISSNQRIEVLSLDDIMPDPWNPRHVLPDDIRADFISRKKDAHETISQWIKVSEKNPTIADQLQKYRLMGISLIHQGQINPITVAKHFSDDGTFVWRIESGERRFWSKWLVVYDQLTDERSIHAILREQLSPTRQAVENLQAEPLSAVGEARQIARLFLDQLGITPDSDVAKNCTPGCDDYFRLALSPTNELLVGRKRLPRGFWPALEQIMGNKRQHLERKLQILKLPDSLLSIVDSHQLTERQLREIIAMPHELWEQIINDVVEYQLTGPELAFISRADEYNLSLQTILDNRHNQLETIAEKPKPLADQKPVSDAFAPEQLIQKRVVSLVKYFGRTSKIFGDEWPLDKLVDNMTASGDHRIVLENAVRLEELIRRLKSRAAKLTKDEPERE